MTCRTLPPSRHCLTLTQLSLSHHKAVTVAFSSRKYVDNSDEERVENPVEVFEGNTCDPQERARTGEEIARTFSPAKPLSADFYGLIRYIDQPTPKVASRKAPKTYAPR